MATAHLVREAPPEMRIRRSAGSFVFDSRGRRYVDFVMGWCVGNFGWGNAVMHGPARRYDGPDYVPPHFDHPPWEELARLLALAAPAGLERCLRATGGSEAVDLALQAAMVHTGRAGFLSIEGSYHGNTLACLSVGASEYREHRPNLLRKCAKVRPPLDERALGRMERLLRRRDIAAVIMEPIAINLGVLIPPEGFLREVKRLCRDAGTLLILDEVATGFGRTGTLFAAEQFGVSPDLLTLGKAITDGASGMGAVLATPAVARSMRTHGAFYSTYGWHPRSVDVAISALRYIRRNERRLLARVSTMSEYFGMRLAAMPLDGAAVRRRGLAIGIDLGDGKRASAVVKRCLQAGLIVSSEEGTLILVPALTIDHATAAAGLDILERCL